MNSAFKRTPLRDLYPATSEFTPAERSELRAYDLQRRNDYHNSHNQAAFEVNCLLSPDDLSSIRAIFGNQLVYQSPNARRRCTHPIARACHEYAAADLFNEASQHRRFIDVGGNVLKAFKNPKHHACTIVTDARELFRQLSQFYSSQENEREIKGLFHFNMRNTMNIYNDYTKDECFTKGSVCWHGAERCTHQAKFLIANHCLYDINHQQIYEIFKSHNADVMVSWTWYPAQLFWEEAESIFKHSGINDFYTIRKNETTTEMYLNDSSFAYVHSTENWKHLLTTSIIIGDQFNIAVEIQDTIGCMYKQRWVKIPKSSVHDLKFQFFHECFRDYVLIPNLYDYTDSMFTSEMDYILCPRTFYTRCLNFGLKSLDCKAEVLHQFAVSITTRIDIKDTVINESFHVDPQIMNKIVYSFVFMTIIRRRERGVDMTRFIDELVRTTKNPYVETTWIYPFRRLQEYLIKTKHQMLENKILKKQKRTHNGKLEYYSKLDEFKVLEFAPIICSEAAYGRDTFNYSPIDHEYMSTTDEESDGDNDQNDDDSDDRSSRAGSSTSENSNYSDHTQTDKSHSSRQPSLSTLNPTGGMYSNYIQNTMYNYGSSRDTCLNSYYVRKTKTNNMSEYLGAADASQDSISYYITSADTQSSKYDDFAIYLGNDYPKYNHPGSYTPSHDVTLKFYGHSYAFRPFYNYKLKHGEDKGMIFGDFETPIVAVKSSPETINNDLTKFKPIMKPAEAIYDVPVAIAKYNTCYKLRSFPGPNVPINGRHDFTDAYMPVDSSDKLEEVDDTLYRLVDRSSISRNHGKESRAAAKLIEMKDVFEIKDHYTRIIDIGAGPGHSARYQPKTEERIAIVYDIPIAECNKQFYHDEIQNDVNKISAFRTVTDTLVYCDIGPADAFLHTYEKVVELSRGYHLLIKAFIPSSKCETNKALLHIITNIEGEVRFMKPRFSGEANREIYIYGQIKQHIITTIPMNLLDKVKKAINMIECTRRAAVHAFLSKYNSSQLVKENNQELISYSSKLKCSREEYERFVHGFLVEKPTNIKKPEKIHDWAGDEFDINIISGVMGCGKSRSIKKMMKDHSYHNILIVPTKLLQENYRKDGIKSYTFHCAINCQRRPKATHLIIDEVFSFYKAYVYMMANLLKPSKITVLGDPLQIPALDFTDTQLFRRVQTMAEAYPRIVNWTNRRNPQDVCTLLRGLGYTGMVGTNPIQNSIYFIDGGEADIPNIIRKYGEGPTYVYNQSTASNMNVYTIHQSQGDTNRNVYFFVDQMAIETSLVNNTTHIRVMLSRHTEKLVFIGAASHMRRYLDYIGSNLDINLSRYGLLIHDVAIPVEILQQNAGYRPSRLPLVRVDDRIHYPKVNIDMVLDIMQRTFKENDFLSDIAGITDTKIDHEGGGRLTIKMEKFMDNMRKMHLTGFKIVKNTFAKQQFSDALTAIGSMSGRYCKNTRRIGINMVVNDVASMFNNFSKLVRDDLPDIDIPMDFDDELTMQVLNKLDHKTLVWLKHLRRSATREGMYEYHHSEALRSIDAKQMSREEYDTLIESSKDFWVSFFPKKQVKAKLQTQAYDFRKVSQGVAAYMKNINILYAAFGRLAAQLLPTVLLDNVIMAANMTDAEFSARVGEIKKKYTEKHGVKKLDKAAGDFTEFDSTQGVMAYILTSVLYIILGMPPCLVARLRDHSDKWTMYTDFIKVIGELKFHSGTFETWFRNTFYNMCNISSVYTWVLLVLAVFTGDDSALEGLDIQFTNQEWLEKNKLLLKDEKPPVIEFAGKFICDHAVAPDALRRVAKYLSKIYSSQEQYSETIISLRNGLEMIPDQYTLDEVCALTNQYYNYTNMFAYVPSPDEIKVLFGFLNAEAKDPRRMKEMIVRRMEIIPVAQRA